MREKPVTEQENKILLKISHSLSVHVGSGHPTEHGTPIIIKINLFLQKFKHLFTYLN